jgi:hypothetical protein
MNSSENITGSKIRKVGMSGFPQRGITVPAVPSADFP